MITAFLLWIITIFLSFITFFLGLIVFFIPGTFQESIAYFFHHILYLGGWINISVLMQVLGVVSAFYSLYFLVKLLLWVFGHMPWIGKHADMPTIDIENEIDLRSIGKAPGRVVNLRGGRKYNVKSRTTKDIR